MVVSSPVQEPQAGDPAWQGRQLVAALTWSPGHWVTYVCTNGVWWSVDSAGAGVLQANPFRLQSPNLTINILAFKQ